MRDRKHVALTVALLMLLLALPVAAGDGHPKTSFWDALLAPFQTILQYLDGTTNAPHEATTDDTEIFPCIPTGG
jgi:hypothetical protein